MSNNKTGSEFSAFLIGGLIGVAAGILLAPKSGRETREDIEDWLDETVEKTKENSHMLNEKLHAAKANIEERIKQLNQRVHNRTKDAPKQEDNPFNNEENA